MLQQLVEAQAEVLSRRESGSKATGKVRDAGKEHWKWRDSGGSARRCSKHPIRALEVEGLWGLCQALF